MSQSIFGFGCSKFGDCVVLVFGDALLKDHHCFPFIDLWIDYTVVQIFTVM